MLSIQQKDVLMELLQLRGLANTVGAPKEVTDKLDADLRECVGVEPAPTLTPVSETNQ